MTACQVKRSNYYPCMSLTKSFFNIVKDCFKSFEVLCGNFNIPLGFKAEGIFVLDGLRKKYLARCQIFALKILSLYSLTKSVFQYSEALIQII